MTTTPPARRARLIPAGQGYLHFAVLMGGFTTLAVELSAARLLGNVFGTSNLVWAGIIGLILLYLTAGYFIGGRWADRDPRPTLFYQIMAWGGFTVAIIPLLAEPVLNWAVAGVVALSAPVAAGALAATMVLHVVPITLLGTLSPFAIRLALDAVQDGGHTAGRLYAVSTLGSLVGSFAPVLVMIPLLGTRLTYVTLAGLLLVVALVGLARHDRRATLRLALLPLVVVAIGVWLSTRPIKPVAGLLHERESAYNLIQVVEREGTRYLLLNEGQGIHSVYSPDNPTTFGTWDYFSIAPFFYDGLHPDDVHSAAIIGLAAGTVPKQWTLAFGDIPIDGVEIDGEIVDVGREYFAMNEPNLNVIVADGRWALAQSTARYSIIGVDAYRLPYIPWQLTTYEFFSDVRAHLDPDHGALVINVGRTASDRRLINAMTSTLQAVFPSVYVMDVPGTFNSIMVATVRPTHADALRDNWAALQDDAPPFLAEALARGYLTLRPLEPSGVVFTDDHAPIEAMTNAIVLNFVLGGEFAALTGSE